MISPTGATKNNLATRRGFTLIEVMLVVIVLGILLALAAPNFSKGFARLQLKKTAEDILTICRWAQAMAIGQQKTYVLVFSDDRKGYDLEREIVNEASDEPSSFEPVKGQLGQMHILPKSITLESRDDRIQFHPDGTIDPAEVKLSSPSQKSTTLSSIQVRGMMTQVDNE